MKLVCAFVQDYDSDRLLSAITAAGLAATKISSMGGFLRIRNSTIFIGLEDDRVAECLKVIERTCKSRVEAQPEMPSHEFAEWYGAGIHEVTMGGAVVFVVGVSAFYQLRPDSHLTKQDPTEGGRSDPGHSVAGVN